MISVFPQSATLSQKDTPFQQAKPQELGSLHDAVASFTKLTLGSGTNSVRLYCTIPTWNSSDMCLDLYDHQELRSRFLLFIHDLLQSLRSLGISASYSLAPSSSSLCLVCHKPIDVDVLQQLQDSKENLKREQVTLVDLNSGPCLIIT
ncbi:hypothetical protein HYPSUDRAFT_61271 [Hypholoma sublateritium FD-334 SS-4]|uniref:Uncharacterized protein n=1 Tax=Hypholoma sublateritium (strain FD-334 SS-4) TaxID=945553 RepID=A0A0D2PLM7_HYPSF|nr:hypothetical protein HYPSUDRAFT_61271 [Hypholoma sublateritium FD-334 SS-4]